MTADAKLLADELVDGGPRVVRYADGARFITVELFRDILAALRRDTTPPYVLPGPWQPIATAPKEGEVLLLVKSRAGIQGKMLVGHHMPGGHCIEDHPPIAGGWYFWNGCMFDRAAEPTHWMPLPDAPQTISNGVAK